MTVDISQLPPPDVIEAIDFEAVLGDRKDKLVELHPECAEVIGLESEPMVKQLEEALEQKMKSEYPPSC